MPVSFVHRSMLHMQLHVISPARARALCSADITRYTTDNSTVEFFIRTHQTKALVATPMFAALLVIEASDVIFAIDSIPCILGRWQLCPSSFSSTDQDGVAGGAPLPSSSSSSSVVLPPRRRRPPCVLRSRVPSGSVTVSFA